MRAQRRTWALLGPHATQPRGELGGVQVTGASTLSEPIVTRMKPLAVHV